MSEREVVLDEPVMDEQSVALQQAVERAERAEAELAKLKRAAAKAPAPGTAHAAGESHTAMPGDNLHSGDLFADDSQTREHSRADDLHHRDHVATHAASHPHRMEEGHALHNPELTGIDALREDAMMRHLLDSLASGENIGHYGRLTFTMIARHFLPEEEVIAELTRDEDFSEEQARLMVHQVQGRDYSPPRRERIAEWHSQQEFPIIPQPHDPDCGNVYRSLKFPTKTYNHIEHYQEEKQESGS